MADSLEAMKVQLDNISKIVEETRTDVKSQAHADVETKELVRESMHAIEIQNTRLERYGDNIKSVRRSVTKIEDLNLTQHIDNTHRSLGDINSKLDTHEEKLGSIETKESQTAGAIKATGWILGTVRSLGYLVIGVMAYFGINVYFGNGIR